MDHDPDLNPDYDFAHYIDQHIEAQKFLWKGMKRENSDKTRFCVSQDCLTNGLETFCLPCFLLENKTKNMFCEQKGLQYIVDHAILSQLKK